MIKSSILKLGNRKSMMLELKLHRSTIVLPTLAYASNKERWRQGDEGMYASKHLWVFLNMLPKHEAFYSWSTCSWKDGEAYEAKYSIHIQFCPFPPIHSCCIFGVTSVRLKTVENVPDLVLGEISSDGIPGFRYGR